MAMTGNMGVELKKGTIGTVQATDGRMVTDRMIPRFWLIFCEHLFENFGNFAISGASTLAGNPILLSFYLILFSLDFVH